VWQLTHQSNVGNPEPAASRSSCTINMSTTPFFQIVVSQLKKSASRTEFVELHRQTAVWMKAYSGCLAYEVYEGKNGAIADRITWSSKEAAMRGNKEYAATAISQGMQRIVEGYHSFFGEQVRFE
jgi:hypothetical protein